MSSQNKTIQTESSVQDFVSKIADLEVQKQTNQLIELMKEITGHNPKMWGPSIIGFDTYHYKYDSGREGDSPVIGFSPRKNNFALYLLDGTSKFEQQLKKLGKHSTGKACLYVKSLSDIDMDVLKEIAEKSYTYTKSQDGKMHRAE